MRYMFDRSWTPTLSVACSYTSDMGQDICVVEQSNEIKILRFTRVIVTRMP